RWSVRSQFVRAGAAGEARRRRLLVARFGWICLMPRRDHHPIPSARPREERTMQPTTDAAGDAKTNGSPTAAPTEANGSTISAIQLHDLLHALQAVRVGDFSVRMAGDHVGIVGKIADTFNDIVAANQRMAAQLERVGNTVGREGNTRQRVRFGLTDGLWGEMESSV